jgi:hypothetical protein
VRWQLLKVSRKTKKLLTKQNYKALKVFKAFKLIKVITDYSMHL